MGFEKGKKLVSVITIDHIKYCLDNTNLSCAELARKLNVRADTLRRSLIRRNIQVRNGSEDSQFKEGYRGRKSTIMKRGYVYIFDPSNKDADPKGYVKEHRIIMSNYLNRDLSTEEKVHHIDGDKTNNKIENLLLVSIKEHMKLHLLKEHYPKYYEEETKKLWLAQSLVENKKATVYKMI